MAGIYLFDTNAAIALLNKDKALNPILQEAEAVFLSVTVVEELCYGAENSRQSEENLAKIDDLLIRLPIVECNTGTAKYYGRIRGLLKKAGQPIPDNDIWIAATAMQYQLTLLTKDQHFQFIEGLRTASW
jgi:tRNA(fMet)-specific endonuclease VapC